MNKLDKLDYAHYIFGGIQIIANRIDTLLERELIEFDVTSKQFLLSIILDNLFDEPPIIKDAALMMGSSHQNVKQVALKLQQKGLLKLEKDKNDARQIRLALTDESYEFWQKTESKGRFFMGRLFDGISDDELSVVSNVFEKLQTNLEKIESD